MLSSSPDEEAQPVFTREVAAFGSPRVGTKRYIQHAKVRHLRWVDNNDMVTRVPPRWLRRFDHSSDHAIAAYVAHIRGAAESRTAPDQPRR